MAVTVPNPVSPTIGLHFAQDKSNPEIGLQICKYVGNFLNTGFNGYYGVRDQRFQSMRLWATGLQPMTQFMDMMQINAKNSYVNLDFTPPAIMPKYIQQIMDMFMDVDEKPQATAIDQRSNKKKLEEKRAAEFRMKHAQEIAQAQQQTGVQLEDPNKFTPQDKDELDIYFGYEFKLPEEAIAEKLISIVLGENAFEETKKMVCKDLIEVGLGVTRSYKDVNGEIKVRRVQPENFFYSYCRYPDFRDAAFMGELYNMPITEFRKRFSTEYMGDKGMDEKEIFEIAMKFGSTIQKDNLTWTTDYYDMYYRPYDEWTIPLIYVEVKTDSTFFIKEKKTRSGHPIIDFSTKIPRGTGKDTKVTSQNLDKVYTGWWLRDSDIMLDWGPSRYDIRPPDNLSEQFFTYSAYMYDAFEMRNVAVPEKIKTSVFMMILAHLKIQQVTAKMRPPGLAIDLYSASSIDIGEGRILKPLDMEKFLGQTGNFYWSSRSPMDGETIQGVPFTALPNAEGVAQLQMLTAIYNFYLERLQADLGTNAAASAQTLSPRQGLGVTQAQLKSARSSVSNIYDAWSAIGDQTCAKVGIMLWDDIVYDVSTYRQFLDDDYKPDKDVSFKFKMKMLPTADEREYLEQLINSGVSAGILDFDQAFKVRNIVKENVKIAEMYLARMQRNKVQQETQKAMDQMKMNQQVQAASIQQNTQSKEAVEMAKAKGKIIGADQDNENKKEQLVQQFIQQALIESMKTGVPLSGYTQSIVESYLSGNMPTITKNSVQQTQQQADMAQQQGSAQPGQPGQPGQGQPQQVAQ